MDIKGNIEEIHKRVEAALSAAGRRRDDLTIIGVTKHVDPDLIQQAISYGISDLGENKVQELIAKLNMRDPVKWHMIGRLQRNKVKYLANKDILIHSLDSLSLAEEIDAQGAKVNKAVSVLVQVNPANEETKAGLPIEEITPFMETLYNRKFIQVKGLMMIAPQAEEPETIRPYFTMMRQLFDSLKQQDYPHIDMRFLSMGMSNDFEMAIEEGSNMVRIGTAIFGKRRKGEETCQEDS